MPVGERQLVDQQQREHFGITEAGRGAARGADTAGAVALEPGVHDQVYSNQQGIEVHVHRKPPAKVVTLPLYYCDTFSVSPAQAGVMHHALLDS
jgi:hypothetical protein